MAYSVQQYGVQQYGLAGYQVQWVQYIAPVVMGIMMLVLIAGMVRDLIKGEEVKLPF